MSKAPDIDQVVGELQASIGLLVRRLRQTKSVGALTRPESSALSRLDRDGPTTSSALAKLEQISPQSMGATLSALEARRLVERQPDPGDGRKVIISPTPAGRQALQERRDSGIEAMTRALSVGFSPAELNQFLAAAPLFERLAQSI